MTTTGAEGVDAMAVEIRIAAVEAASRVAAGATASSSRTTAREVVDFAATIETYIRTGKTR